MPDLEMLNALLDQAEADLEKLQKLTDEFLAEVDASPPEDRARFRDRFLELCHRRAEIAKKHVDASLAVAAFDLGKIKPS